MQTLSEAVATLQAQRDQEQRARREAEIAAAAAKVQRQQAVVDTVAAYLQEREGIDLTDDSDVTVLAEENGTKHYGIEVVLPGGHVNCATWARIDDPYNFDPAATLQAWEKDGWNSHVTGDNGYYKHSTLVSACLEVMRQAKTGPFKPTDTEADA
jgi:hypothetical protein